MVPRNSKIPSESWQRGGGGREIKELEKGAIGTHFFAGSIGSVRPGSDAVTREEYSTENKSDVKDMY